MGEGEYFLASDAAPFVDHTRRWSTSTTARWSSSAASGYEVTTIDNVPLEKEVMELEMDLEEIEKGGYEHFMLKEIMEQPESLENCMRGRLRVSENMIQLGGLLDVMDTLKSAQRILICACGTSLARGARGRIPASKGSRASRSRSSTRASSATATRSCARATWCS